MSSQVKAKSGQLDLSSRDPVHRTRTKRILTRRSRLSYSSRAGGGGSPPETTLLRARAVLTVSRAPIRDGAVVIRNGRILAVGSWPELRDRRAARLLDLGDVVLLPGLINSHCHLDYTLMAGHFPPPAVFTDWLKAITEAKAGWELSDYLESWRTGAAMLVKNGTTTVGDIEAIPELLPQAWEATPLRVFSFLEMIGITARRPPRQLLSETLGRIRTLTHARSRAALSPHAPYSTIPELLELTARATVGRQPVCVHVAESALEYQMFRHASGAMFSWLQRSGRDMADCGSGSPVQHLERCGLLGRNLLATHVNYLATNDAELLAARGVNVIHCPRSHGYFRHRRFPLGRLRRAGVNICLGTDSLASVYRSRGHMVELNMFEEMRTLSKTEPTLSPRAILRMATVNPARAFGMPGRLGELVPGAMADLIAVPLTSGERRLEEQVLHHPGGVAASMIDGYWAVRPAHLPGALT